MEPLPHTDSQGIVRFTYTAQSGSSQKTKRGYGYVVGLHEKLTGKAALVWVIDEEQLEMDMPEPDPPEP